jgi:hypothetical protein
MRESEYQRRLRVAGYDFEPSAAGKHLWRHPVTGRLLPEHEAAEQVRQEETRRLKEAGWEPVDGDEEEKYWRRPDTGRLYPRGAAYDVMRRLEETRGRMS